MFQGSIVAIVTPMYRGVSPDAPLDFDSLQRLIEFHIENQTDAIVIVGTTGESATLDNVEHCDVIRQAVLIANRRIPIIAGTGANATTEAIHLTNCAKKAGANACLLVTPYYNKPTQEGLYLHYKTIAEAVDIPQILYNVPGRTACDMLPKTVGRLAKIENIIGLKEASADMNRVKEIRTLCGKDFLLFSGDDATAREFILRGGNGTISVTANIAPKAMHDMCMASINADPELASEIDELLVGLHKHLFVESNPIPVKWALNKMGFIEAGIRLPLTWLSANAENIVLNAMQQAKII